MFFDLRSAAAAIFFQLRPPLIWCETRLVHDQGGFCSLFQ